MSQGSWTVTMFGAYLDLEDLAKALPGIPKVESGDYDALELEEYVNKQTRLQSCAHMCDGQIIGIGIGLLFKEGSDANALLAGIRNTEDLADHLPKIFKKKQKKPKILEFENSDDG